MAEVQTSSESGEMTQRFLEFVMMQAQNAALFMGQIPSPEGQGPEINLDVAKMFIDQLVMIRVKTKGNLTGEEQGVLNNAISNLQMTFVEVSQRVKAGSSPVGAAPPHAAPEPTKETGVPEAEPAIQTEEGAGETGSRKRFTKSYGS